MSHRVGLWIAILIFHAGCEPLARPVNPEWQRGAKSFIDAGTLLLRQQRLDEAAAAFTLSLELQESAQAVDGLGCVAFAAGDMALAERLFSRSLVYEPGYADAARNLAAVFEHTGRPEQAQELLRRVVGAAPLDFRARNNLSASLYDAGEGLEAHEQLLGAALMADHPIIRHNLRTGSGR